MSDRIIADVVLESTTTTGVGTLDLEGASLGDWRFRTFFDDNDAVTYCRINELGTKKQIIEGKMKWGTGAGGRDQLTIDKVVASTDGGATPTAIDWQADDVPSAVFPVVSANMVDSMARWNYGTTRPSWLRRGVWVKGGTVDTPATARKVYWFDGTDDIELFRLNETANTWSLSGVSTMARATDVATVAGTTNIWAPAPDDGHIVHLTGTNAPTNFGVAPVAGAWRWVIFDAAGVAIPNNANIATATGAGIITQAGDRALIVADTTTLARMLVYQRADGTALVAARSAERQTVQAGPIDTSGLPTFLPSTSGSLTLSTQNVAGSAPLVVDAAGGFGAAGALGRLGVAIANLTWTGLTASRAAATPNFLYVLVGTDGVLTPGFTIQPPVYQQGGTPSTGTGVVTFNIGEMKCYLGNGTTAPQVYLVLLGEAATDGSGVISTVAYAYNGRYESAWTATLPGVDTTVTKNHNIGVIPTSAAVVIENTTIDLGYAVGQQVLNPLATESASSTGISLVPARNTLSWVTGHAGTGVSARNLSTFAVGNATSASWKYKLIAQRDW